MSTRSTIAYVETGGRIFHLYEDLADSSRLPPSVYLHVERTDGFDLDDSVLIRIPLDVWRKLREGRVTDPLAD